MQIILTKEILSKQARLLQEVSTRLSDTFSKPHKISLSSCYELLAKSYGYASWNVLSALLKSFEATAQLESEATAPLETNANETY